ncbi:MFS transporter [Chloroflexota bacterium]
MSARAISIIVAGFLTLFMGFAIRYSYGMLLPEMLPSLEITKIEAGVIFSSYFIAYTVFSPVLGFLSDRYSIRTILTICVTLLGIGTFLMAFSWSVFTASAFFTLAGIGHAAGWVPVVTLIQRWVSDKRRATALSIADLGSATGIIVWSSIMPLIVPIYGWRGGWMSLGVMALLVAMANFILVRNYPPEKTDTPQPVTVKPVHEPVSSAYKRIVTDMKFWLVGLSYLCIGFVVLIPFTFLSTYAVQELHFSYDIATRLITFLACGGVVGKIVLGPLSDKLGRIKIMILCGIFMALGSIGMVYFREYFALSAVIIVFGLGYGAVWPLYAACARDFFPKKIAGSVIGLWTLIMGIGSISSPIITGWTIDATGGYTWAFILAVTVSMLSFLLLLPVVKAPHLTQDAQ